MSVSKWLLDFYFIRIYYCWLFVAEVIIQDYLEGRVNADPTPLSITNKDEVIIQALNERFKWLFDFIYIFVVVSRIRTLDRLFMLYIYIVKLNKNCLSKKNYYQLINI